MLKTNKHWHLTLMIVSPCRFLGIAMVVCFIWIVLMRWLTGIIVWFSIFAVLGVISYGELFFKKLIQGIINVCLL